MATILGKRTRSSRDPVAQSPRAKRQARTEIYTDEDENPFVGRASRTKGQDGDSMDLDELSASVQSKKISVSRLVRKLNTIREDEADENTEPTQNPTPRTPRHRDALSKKTPITPKHRVMLTGKPLTPKTPRTLTTPGGSIATVYSQARQIFTRSSDTGRLIGREAEREELINFIQTGLTEVHGGCTYVSGPPGTGKSAMVSEVTENFEPSNTLQKLYINCMSLKTSKDLYGTLLEAFCSDMEVMDGEEVQTLQSIFVPKKKSSMVYLVTLDEIDHVLTLDLEILYKLFEWALQKKSKLILIGIANALDLTDRFLPRLKSRNLKPELLPFLPYTVPQINAIITTRLKSLVPAGSATPDYVPFLHPAAIELCSRKVAGQSGDLRKAFDICKRVIDLIEQDTKAKHESALNEKLLPDSPSRKPLQENANMSSPQKTINRISLAASLATLTVETAPRASIGHINKITSTTFSHGTTQRLKSLNLQQKAALCALVALEKRKRDQAANLLATPSKTKLLAPTIKALYDVYCMLCKRDSVLHPLTSTEFRDVVGSLETLSLVCAVDGKSGSFVATGVTAKRGRKALFGGGVGVGDEKRVGSCVSDKEVLVAVEGLGGGILKSILSGEGLD